MGGVSLAVRSELHPNGIGEWAGKLTKPYKLVSELEALRNLGTSSLDCSGYGMLRTQCILFPFFAVLVLQLRCKMIQS